MCVDGGKECGCGRSEWVRESLVEEVAERGDKSYS